MVYFFNECSSSSSFAIAITNCILVKFHHHYYYIFTDEISQFLIFEKPVKKKLKPSDDKSNKSMDVSRDHLFATLSIRLGVIMIRMNS
jgi:hypothetical protein